MESDGSYSHAGNCSNPKCEACAYHRGFAEGRKAAEKDFQELLAWANDLAAGLAFPTPIGLRFTNWKKARGIE